MDLLTGEHLALDLLNTSAGTPGGDIDALDRAEDFGAWLDAQADRLVPPDGPVSPADLAAVRKLRAQIADAVDRARQRLPPETATRDSLNAAVRAAPRYAVLVVEQGVAHTVPRRDGGDRAQLLAQLAEAAIDLLTDPAVVNVRSCEGPQCRMLFLPAHPRRRWCSPTLCGNRARVARYYQRHSTGEEPNPSVRAFRAR